MHGCIYHESDASCTNTNNKQATRRKARQPDHQLIIPYILACLPALAALAPPSAPALISIS